MKPLNITAVVCLLLTCVIFFVSCGPPPSPWFEFSAQNRDNCTGIILDIPVIGQDGVDKCWAASAAMISSFLAQDNNNACRFRLCRDQTCVTRIHHAAMGNNNDSGNRLPVFFRLNIGCDNKEFPPEYNDIIQQFNNHSPVGFIWTWNDLGDCEICKSAHYMVASGYLHGNDFSLIAVNDPFPVKADKDEGGSFRLVSFRDFIGAPDHYSYIEMDYNFRPCNRNGNLFQLDETWDSTFNQLQPVDLIEQEKDRIAQKSLNILRKLPRPIKEKLFPRTLTELVGNPENLDLGAHFRVKLIMMGELLNYDTSRDIIIDPDQKGLYIFSVIDRNYTRSLATSIQIRWRDNPSGWHLAGFGGYRVPLLEHAIANQNPQLQASPLAPTPALVPTSYSNQNRQETVVVEVPAFGLLFLGICERDGQVLKLKKLLPLRKHPAITDLKPFHHFHPANIVLNKLKSAAASYQKWEYFYTPPK